MPGRFGGRRWVGCRCRFRPATFWHGCHVPKRRVRQKSELTSHHRCVGVATPSRLAGCDERRRSAQVCVWMSRAIAVDRNRVAVAWKQDTASISPSQIESVSAGVFDQRSFDLQSLRVVFPTPSKTDVIGQFMATPPRLRTRESDPGHRSTRTAGHRRTDDSCSCLDSFTPSDFRFGFLPSPPAAHSHHRSGEILSTK